MNFLRKKNCKKEQKQKQVNQKETSFLTRSINSSRKNKISTGNKRITTKKQNTVKVCLPKLIFRPVLIPRIIEIPTIHTRIKAIL